MLPDCPGAKRDIRDRLNSLFRSMVNRHLGVVAQTPRSHIHEGRRNVIVRESGEVDETPMIHAAASFNIQIDEVPTMTLEVLVKRMDAAAQDMAKQIAAGFFKTLSDAVEKTGNVVDGKGKGFTAETILDYADSRIRLQALLKMRPKGRAAIASLSRLPNGPCF